MSNRDKGHNWERALAQLWRDRFGFSRCKTTRESSQLKDKSKIDLDFIPWILQAKSGYRKRRPKYDVIYRQVKEMIGKFFPKNHPVHEKEVVLVHKIDQRKKENTFWVFNHDHITSLLEDYFELGRFVLKLKHMKEKADLHDDIEKIVENSWRYSEMTEIEKDYFVSAIEELVKDHFLELLEKTSKEIDDLEDALAYYTTNGKRGFNPILEELKDKKKEIDDSGEVQV